MKVAILGTGAYGLALALMVHENKCDIMMWTKFEDEKEMLECYRENKRVLPGVKIPDNIKFTTNMKDAISEADLIIVAVPAGFVDDVSMELKKYYRKEQHFCIASKGIEQDTCLFVTDVFNKHVKTNRLAVISGGSFAVDIVKKVPIGLSLATRNRETEMVVKNALQNKYMKLRSTKDILGIEICGSIKNVIAIASGMLNGMGYPESTQCMFITESLPDIKTLFKKFCGKKKTIKTFSGVCGLGLTFTCYKSRNFSFGKMIGEGKSKKEISDYMENTTIEGIYTLKSIYKLIKNKHVDMPIIDLIYDIIYKDVKPQELANFLRNKD